MIDTLSVRILHCFTRRVINASWDFLLVCTHYEIKFDAYVFVIHVTHCQQWSEGCDFNNMIIRLPLFSRDATTLYA